MNDMELEKQMEQQVQHLGYEWICLEMQSRPRVLRAFIDHPDGIKLSDCERVSHQLSDWLDTLDSAIRGSYRLEVSSPGEDRPLKKAAHFRAAIGLWVRLNVPARVHPAGRIRVQVQQVDEAFITVMDSQQQRLKVPLAAISKARLIPNT